MKTSILLVVLVCMLAFILLGCRTDHSPSLTILEPHGPKGFCEAVSKKYRFRFEKEPEIVSIQALIRKNRIVVILGDSQGYTRAFLIRSVRPISKIPPLRNVETFTLSYPRKVLKLEEVTAEAKGLKFNKKKYVVFVSYDKQNWIPLSEAKLSPKELSRDIALMERTWKDAQRIAVVNQCKDYNEVSQKRSFKKSYNCGIPENACNAVWTLSLDNVLADRDAEFADPPFGIGPDDDLNTGWSAGGGGGGGGRTRDCVGEIDLGLECGNLNKRQGFGNGETVQEAISEALHHLQLQCAGGSLEIRQDKVCDYSTQTRKNFVATVVGCCFASALEELPDGTP